MPIPHITLSLIERIDRFNASFHAARMGAAAALTGNPFEVEILKFGSGHGVACKVRHPLLRGKNRIQGFRPENIGLLNELLDFYRADGLRCSLSVPSGMMTPELFRRLTEAGLWSSGSGTVPFAVPEERSANHPTQSSSGIRVRPSGVEEKELYLDLFQQAFADRSECAPEYRAFQWAEDALPGGRRYVAEMDGRPIGMASFPIVNGVGFFGTGGVLPAYRGRGVQMALIQCRLADALDFGCDLVLGGSSPGTIPYRNFERAGLRLIPTAMSWSDIQP